MCKKYNLSFYSRFCAGTLQQKAKKHISKNEIRFFAPTIPLLCTQHKCVKHVQENSSDEVFLSVEIIFLISIT